MLFIVDVRASEQIEVSVNISTSHSHDVFGLVQLCQGPTICGIISGMIKLRFHHGRINSLSVAEYLGRTHPTGVDLDARLYH